MVVSAEDFARISGATADQMERLETYLDLLAEWNEKMNLVGPATLPDFWNRHVLDSAQLLDLAPEARTWADLGTGAGLPGVVLAILGRGRPGFHVHLVESLQKRCRFLDEVVRRLDLPATVHNARAEDIRLKADVVTARACAPLTRLLAFARPYLKQGALGLFLKGQDVQAELEQARRDWDLEAEVLQSRSDERGRIVKVRRLGNVRRN